MQIAPVSVVFALATAGALGMAVRDVVTGPKVSISMSEEVAALDRLEAEQRYQREELEEQQELAEAEERARAEDERMFAARRPFVPTLFGDEVASLGPAFGPLQLGMSVERFAVSRAELDARFEDAALILEARAATQVASLSVLGIHQAHVVCPLVQETVVERWGPPTVPATELQQIWWNAKTGNRFRIDTTSSCELVFEKAQPLDTWVARMQTVAALKTRAQVERAALQAVAEARDLRDESTWWAEPGLAAGEGPTSVYVLYDGDAVTSMDFEVSSDPDTIAAVEKKLREIHGKPSDETTDAVIWASRHVQLRRVSTTRLMVTYGEPQ